MRYVILLLLAGCANHLQEPVVTEQSEPVEITSTPLVDKLAYCAGVYDAHALLMEREGLRAAAELIRGVQRRLELAALFLLGDHLLEARSMAMPDDMQFYIDEHSQFASLKVRAFYELGDSTTPEAYMTECVNLQSSYKSLIDATLARYD